MAAVRAGVGRETAHEVIKEHAVAVALAMREQGGRATTCSTGWPPTSGSGWTAPRWTALVAEPIEFTGAARDQVARVVDRIEALVAAAPAAAAYTPGAIL